MAISPQVTKLQDEQRRLAEQQAAAAQGAAAATGSPALAQPLQRRTLPAVQSPVMARLPPGVTREGNSFSQAPGVRTVTLNGARPQNTVSTLRPARVESVGETAATLQPVPPAPAQSAPIAVRESPLTASLSNAQELQDRTLRQAEAESGQYALQQQKRARQGIATTLEAQAAATTDAQNPTPRTAQVAGLGGVAPFTPPVKADPANLAQTQQTTAPTPEPATQTEPAATTAPTLANPEQPATVTTPVEPAAPQSELEKLGIQRTGDSYSAAPGGLASTAGTDYGTPSQPATSAELVDSLNAASGQMQRERLQRQERRDARRLQNDISAAGRYARYYAGQAVSSDPGGQVRVNPGLAKSAADWQAQQQSLQQLQNTQAAQGPLISGQLQADAELETARGQVAAQQTAADAQQTAANAQLVDAANQQRRETTTERETAKATVKTQQERNEAVRNAGGLAQQLGELTKLNDKGITGIEAGPRRLASRMAEFLGIGGEYATEAEQFEAISNALAGSLTSTLPGPLTEKELKFLQNQVPLIGNTQAGNDGIIRTLGAFAIGRLRRFGLSDDEIVKAGFDKELFELSSQIDQQIDAIAVDTPSAGAAAPADANARAKELADSGMGQDEILDQLEAEGY